MSLIDRRKFLAAAAATAAAGPWIWAKKSHAAAIYPGFGRAKHLLILYAGGGLRGAPLFHADVSLEHNPYGKVGTMPAGAEWCAGALLGEEVAALGADITVLAGVDHDPLSDRPVTDHGEANARLTTVSELGLLALIQREHASYRGGGKQVLPPVDLGLSSFAASKENVCPLSLRSAADFTGRSKSSADARRASWFDLVREARDTRFIAAQSPALQRELLRLRDVSNASRAYGAQLRDPALDLLGAPEASLGGADNAALLGALGSSTEGFGLDVALALRLFQLGVPAVSVYRNAFDTHSREDDTFPALARDLARQISGLHRLLHTLRDPEGAVLWDSTVVIVVSELARDNADPRTGFNSARGSDHLGSPASRNQVWPIFGGPIGAKGRRIGALDPATLSTLGGPAISIPAVHATLLALLGIDPSVHLAVPPIGALFG